MAGYFGTEPTCARCDYPKRLHYRLRVEHEYTERPNENAPDAGQGIEGNEIRTDNQEGTDSVTQTTTPTEPQPLPTSRFTLEIVLGVFALALIVPKPGPVKLNVITSAGKVFHLTTAESVQEIMPFAERHAARCSEVLGKVEFEHAPDGLIAAYEGGQELYYRYECPEFEPRSESDDADFGDLVTLASAQIGDSCEVTFDRFADKAGTDDQIAFSATKPGGDGPWIRPDEIPNLVDELLEMHRTWLQIVAADEADQ